jgi:hypothetical protein
VRGEGPDNPGDVVLGVAGTCAFLFHGPLIAGAKNLQQLESWLHAGELELQDEDLEPVACSIRESGDGTVPASPAEVRSAAG